MCNHHKNIGFPGNTIGKCCARWVLTIVAVSVVVTSGCGVGQNALLSQESLQIIRGKDSAGATIELEKRGNDLTTARVIDIVLGTGEAEVISSMDGGVEFTIDFPAGVTVTYIGAIQNPSSSSTQALAGTWTQQAAGIFGEDAGTWETAADPALGANR